jgi:prolyl oligopeptidase
LEAPAILEALRAAGREYLAARAVARRPRKRESEHMTMRLMLCAGLIPILAALLAAQGPEGSGTGESSVDPFQWLEDIDGAKALDWVRAQNARTLKDLQSDPLYSQLYREALEILTSKERLPIGEIHGDHVYNFWQDDQHIRGIWRRAALETYRAGKPAWETLLDVDALAKTENENWVFQNANCLPPKYERCLISLSRGGSDASVSREFSTSRKAFVEDGFVTPEGKNGEAWLDENTLLIASDWGEGRTESGYPRAVRKWKRGTPFSQAVPVFEGERKDVGVNAADLRHGGVTYPLIERAVTFYEQQYSWLQPDGRLKLLPLPQRCRIAGAFQGRIIVLLQEPWNHQGFTHASGSLVALRLDNLTAETIFEPSERQALSDVGVGKSYLFAALLDDVAGKAMRFELAESGWKTTDVPVPANGVVKIAGSSGARDDWFVLHESLTTPQTLYHVSPDNRLSKSMTLPAFYDAAGVVVEQHFAPGKDGTRVPYFLMGRKDVLAKGNAPAIQYGYGGFLIPILPVYYENPSRPQHGALAGKLWVSRGGVLVLSNIRGGGEYGPRWHEAALKANRQSAFDDFFAIAEDLIRRGVTSPQKLGAMGRSNGGLLMGVALTQRPDLYGAIDCGVPLFDMKRYNKLLAGASWMGEYGNPDIPEEWAYISKYSPYQNLQKGKAYPKTLIYTSTKDDRVHPGHARKAVAKLAALGYEVYYYENIEGGHGGTTNQEQLAMRTALEYIYFVRQLMREAK